MFKKLTILVLVLALTSAASAGTMQWNSWTGDWEDATNWIDTVTSATGPPAALQFTKISRDASQTVDVTVNSTTAVAGKFQMGYGDCTLTVVDEAILTQDGSFEMYNGSTNLLNIDDGGLLDACQTNGIFKLGGAASTTVTVDGTLKVGSAEAEGLTSVIQMGTTAKFGGYGMLKINNTGLVETTEYVINDGTAGSAGYLMLYGDGTMVIDGNVVWQTYNYIAAGQVYGDDVVGNVRADYNSGTDTTTIRIPEPATIALLGLGGLLLRKRR